jgi:hypothetical protein
MDPVTPYFVPSSIIYFKICDNYVTTKKIETEVSILHCRAIPTFESN